MIPAAAVMIITTAAIIPITMYTVGEILPVAGSAEITEYIDISFLYAPRRERLFFCLLKTFDILLKSLCIVGIYLSVLIDVH